MKRFEPVLNRACRAYKLGKRRWSYNQCELQLAQEHGKQTLSVREATQLGSDSLADEVKVLTSLSFLLTVSSNAINK